MTQTATLLLLFSGEPTRAERALIDAHAHKRDSAYIAPAPTPPAAYPPYDAERVLALEGRLDEARTLASSLDETQALALLAAVERELRAHPELPQAAFLLAERHRLAAAIRRGQPDGQGEAVELAQRATILEGGRAPAFGESATEADVPRATTSVAFSELGPRDELELDGVQGGAVRTLATGEHHVRVLRGEALVYAGFVRYEGTAPSVTLGLPQPLACSAWDLAAVQVRAAAPLVTAGVRCSRWVAVRRVRGGLELSECTLARCGAFVPLEAPARAPQRVLPEWAGVAIAGLASVGVTSLALWAAGAFDRPATPARTEFVYRGPAR